MAVDVLTNAQAISFSNEKLVQVVETMDTLYLYPSTNLPDWCKTQALAVALGEDTKGDGYGGVFYWDSASTATDDGETVVQPDAIEVDADLNPTGAGRWILLFCGIWQIFLGGDRVRAMSPQRRPIDRSVDWTTLKRNPAKVWSPS